MPPAGQIVVMEEREQVMRLVGLMSVEQSTRAGGRGGERERESSCGHSRVLQDTGPTMLQNRAEILVPML